MRIQCAGHREHCKTTRFRFAGSSVHGVESKTHNKTGPEKKTFIPFEVRSSEDSDEFGLQSQERAKAAVDGGYFESQIIPLEIPKFDDKGNRLEETYIFKKDEIPF